VDVIGFGLDPKEVEAVAEIAKAGKGQFYDAKNAQKLNDSVKTIQREVVKSEEADPKEVGVSALVRELMESMKHANATVRNSALTSLEKQAPDKVEEALLDAVKLKDTGVREWAVRHFGLSKMVKASEAVVGVLNECVRDDNATVRNSALGSLKMLAPAKLEAALLAAAKSKHATVKEWALRQLGELNKGK
jgi:hypothetical protein